MFNPEFFYVIASQCSKCFALLKSRHRIHKMTQTHTSDIWITHLNTKSFLIIWWRSLNHIKQICVCVCMCECVDAWATIMDTINDSISHFLCLIYSILHWIVSNIYFIIINILAYPHTHKQRQRETWTVLMLLTCE